MANQQFDRLTQAERESGRTKFANWNDQTFATVIATSGNFFWKKCGTETTGFENYLSLLGEAIGRGYLNNPADPKYYEFYAEAGTWNCVLEYWLVMEIPRQLPDIPPPKRAALLAKLWNLGENLLQQSPWLDPYVLKRLAGQSRELNAIEQ